MQTGRVTGLFLHSAHYSVTALLLNMAKKQKFPHLVGSKWTAQQPTMGWRHFRVTNRKNQGSWVFAEIVAACDPDARFWLNAQLLKDQSVWQSGWKSLNELPLEMES